METTNKMPMINQVYRDAALKSLIESGLPESLIEGVDCSSFETMEDTLIKVKNCFYESVRKHIENTYGRCENGQNFGKIMRQMEYNECDYWSMFHTMDCSVDKNKYIADLWTILENNAGINMHCESSKLLDQKDSFLTSVIMKEIEGNNELKEIFDKYLDTQSEIHGDISKSAFICGFRTAYHLLEECRG